MYADDAVLLIMPKKKAAVSVSAAEVDASLSPAADAAPLSPVDAHTAHLQHLLQEGAALNKDAIRHACRQDGVPHVLRGAVWQVLLDVWGRDDDTLFDANVSLDLKDQSVIQVDLERTRTDEPTFAHKAARDEAAALLTLYCKRRSVPYSQGLNEIVAPFFFIGVPRDVKFQLFYAIVQRFFPLLFRGDNMRRHLDPLMHCLRLLLLYHDPQIVALADQYSVNTELWALPWLFTIFASGVPVAIVLHIWDLLLLCSDNAAPLYFACAVVISQRSNVLSGDPDALALVLRNCLQKSCDTCSSVNDVWVLAENLMMNTPQSFKSVLHKALTSATLTHHVRIFSFDHVLLKQLTLSHEFASCDGQLCMSLEAREVAGVYGTLPSLMKFFVLDCRSRAEFSQGRLPTAMLMDVDAYRADPESMQPILDIVLGLRDQHIAIMGRGHDDADAASIVAMLLAKGMPHVGLINGGYAEILRLAELRLVELADFVPQSEADAESGSKAFLSSPLRHVASALGDATSNVSTKIGSVTSKLESISIAAADKAQVRGKAALDAVAADTQHFADKAHVKARAALGAVAADTQQLKAVAQSKAASAFGFLGAAIGSIKQQFLDEPAAAPVPAPKAAASKDTLIDLGEWLRRDHTTFLTCQYLLPDGSFQPRNIIVAEDLVLFVQAHPTRLNIGKLMHGYKLMDLKQLSFKTEDPNMVTFHFKKEGMTEFKTHTASVTPTQKAQCVAAVKSNMQRLKARRTEQQQRAAAAAVNSLDDKTVAAAAAVAAASRDSEAVSALSGVDEHEQTQKQPQDASSTAELLSATSTADVCPAPAPFPAPETPQKDASAVAPTTPRAASSSAVLPTASTSAMTPVASADDDDFLSFLQSDVPGISSAVTPGSAATSTPATAASANADDDDLPDWLQ